MWIATKSRDAIADPTRVPMWLTYPLAPTRRLIHSVRARRDGYGDSRRTGSRSGRTGTPASPSRRLNASPCQSSSKFQQLRNAVTSGSNAVCVARTSRRKITVLVSMSVM
jgi:hypothetical protein